MSDELPVGRIAGVFGVRGELKCDPTNAGRMVFSAGEKLRADLVDGGSRMLLLQSVREHQGRLLVRFEHFDSVEEAEALKGASLYAPRDRISLQPNEFLDADLTGCKVYDRNALIGTVEGVEHYPASDMLVVRGRMIPLIEEFVKEIDVANKRIDAELPEGLLE
jgi:16S rRNA processing protein RimM